MVDRFINHKKRWANFNREQKKLFFYSLVYLKAASFLLVLFRYQDVYNFLKSRVPIHRAVSSEIAKSLAIEMAEVVEVAARRRLISATCLRRSLVLWYLLRKEGIDSNLRFGVQKAGTKIMGHAWVEIDGSVINDDENIIKKFTPMDLESQY